MDEVLEEYDKKLEEMKRQKELEEAAIAAASEFEITVFSGEVDESVDFV